MAFIGKKPTAAPLTSSDITDGVVSNAKLAQDIISADTALGATPADTDEFLVSDAGTLKRVDYSYIKADNTPSFQAYQGSSQNYGSSSTVITCNTEVFDTSSAYDTSTYRFTPQVAGKYFFYGQIYITSPGTNLTMQVRLAKNGSEFTKGDINSAVNRDQAVVTMGAVSLNGSSDYVQLMGWNSAAKDTVAGLQLTYFGGYKIIE